VLALAGCHSSHKAGPPPPPPASRLTFRQLDAQQQRLVTHYEPVSRALTAYEIAFRDRRGLSAETRSFRPVVVAARDQLRADHATGETAQAKKLLVEGLTARAEALGQPPGSTAYTRAWNRSVVDARRALTLMQDIRDRARLIPLPEDSIS
jgi:hypothetical protein